MAQHSTVLEHNLDEVRESLTRSEGVIRDVVGIEVTFNNNLNPLVEDKAVDKLLHFYLLKPQFLKIGLM